MIKLIASDIDGTLLPEGEKELNPELFDLISVFQKLGIQFVAASGRQLESQKLLFAPVANEISYISENGAIAELHGERFVIAEFDRDLAMRILDELEKCPECQVAVSTPSTQYIKSGNEAFYQHMTTHLNYHITKIGSLKEIKEPIVKIAFLNTVSRHAAYDHFQALFGSEIKVVNAGNDWIDFIPFHSNKGTGLKFLLEKLNLSPAEVVCFGDQQNDIEMLLYAGKSYAMARSTQDVQKAATDITDSVIETLKAALSDFTNPFHNEENDSN